MGCGKTTIAHWVSQLALSKEHIVVWFNPWSSGSLNGMWFQLAHELHRQLVRRGIELSAWTDIKSVATEKWRSAGTATEIDRLRGVSGLVNRVLGFNKDDIEKLEKALGERRVIIIIDDIDRADPAIVPQLLLSLREILDKARFSFLIPYDKRRVVTAIEDTYRHWSGEDFLEKIFDYQLKVPETTVEERWALFEAQMRATLPNTPIERLEGIKDALPDNPRRIKRIIRGVEVMKREISRHGVEEVDLLSIIYALILQLECEPFFDQYVKEVFFSSDKRISEAFKQEGEDKRKEAQLSRIEAIASPFFQDDKVHKQRVIAIAKSWEDSRAYWDNHKVVYALQILNQPHAFTWAEFEGIMQLWRRDRRLTNLLGAISDAPFVKLIPAAVAKRKFAEALLVRYRQHLELATDVFAMESHSIEIDKADEALSALGQLITSDCFPHDIRAALFGNICDAFETFAHFSGNERDAEQRKREIDLLRRVLSLMVLLRPWQRSAVLGACSITRN